MIDRDKIHPVEDPNTVRIESDTIVVLESIRYSPLDEEEAGRPLYLLRSHLEVVIGHGPHGQQPVVIHIPAGFVTDLASIPRLARWYCRPDDPRYIVAAIVHDYLYRFGMVPRFLADAIFRTLIDESAGSARRWLMWSAVRLGGWCGYRKTA